MKTYRRMISRADRLGKQPREEAFRPWRRCREFERERKGGNPRAWLAFPEEEEDDEEALSLSPSGVEEWSMGGGSQLTGKGIMMQRPRPV